MTWCLGQAVKIWKELKTENEQTISLFLSLSLEDSRESGDT
jgi:hypothetical protein